jgi:hypothetical protein
LIEGTTSQIQTVLQFPFVLNADAIQRSISVNPNIHQANSIQSSSSNSLLFDKGEVLELNQMNDNGYKGEGVRLAIFDSGFDGVDTINAFNHLFANNRIVYTYDLVSKTNQVFYDHDHGTAILSVLAASSSNYIGFVPNASYYLFRTEIAATESLIEEFNWLKAAELADSLGVDIVQSSLGYTTFDSPIFNHNYMQLDGKTTMIVQAAELLWSKGVLVVSSAGNDGGNSWKYISTPADGANVIAVGAIDTNLKRAFFSSVGPSADGRIKPDVMAPGTNFPVYSANGSIKYTGGTSLSAPMITALVVGLKQKFPSMTNQEIKSLLIASASQALNPDNEMGYGIPNYNRFVRFEQNEISLYPNPSQENQDIQVVSKDPLLSVQIINEIGSTVYVYENSNTEVYTLTLSRNEFKAQGIFFVRICTNNGIKIIKWIHL